MIYVLFWVHVFNPLEPVMHFYGKDIVINPLQEKGGGLQILSHRLARLRYLFQG
jgi:hypothetical protein